jgi:hypothetical protein
MRTGFAVIHVQTGITENVQDFPTFKNGRNITSQIQISVAINVSDILQVQIIACCQVMLVGRQFSKIIMI